MRRVLNNGIKEPDILMIAYIVKIYMIVLAVVEEDIQEGLRAGRGGTRQPYDPSRQGDGVESRE
jgi:hypothetical protein